MFTVTHFDFRGHAKSASVLSARSECEDIMRKIYKEDPSYWPYGIDAANHDELFLIRKSGSNDPVGFTGWQEFNEGGVKTGYYSIGILPEYRGNGFAKEAVTNLIRTKAATVDRVQAFIVPHNKKSIGLAHKLGVPVRHS